MARDLRVKVRLTADTKQATKNIGRAAKSFSLLNKSFLAIAAGAAVAVLALRSIVRVTSSIIAASSKQIDAENTLTTSLFKLGSQAASTSAALQKQAAALELVTRFGDEVTLVAQAQLAAFIQDENQLKALTIATQDFATAQGIELVGAAQLIAKTIGSSTNALIRYGLSVEGAVNSTERIESLLTSVGSLFGGRALEDAKTFSGRVGQLANAFGTLKERLGDSLTRNREVTKSLTEMRDVIASPEFIKGVDDLAKGISSFASASIKAVAAFPDFLRGLKDAKQAFQDFRDGGTIAGDAIDLLILKLNQLLTPISFAIGGYGALARAAIELGRVNREHAELTEVVARNEEILQARRAGLTAVTAAGVPILDSYAASTERTNAALKDEQLALAGAAAAAALLKTAQDEAAAATTALGAALGEATSTELQGQIDKITENLLLAGEALGTNSDEFVRLEEISREKIGSLSQRILSLKDGLGDLMVTTEDTVTRIFDLGDGFQRAGQDANRFESDLDRVRNGLDRVNTAATASSRSVIHPSTLRGSSGPLFENIISGGTFTVRGGSRRP